MHRIPVASRACKACRAQALKSVAGVPKALFDRTSASGWRIASAGVGSGWEAGHASEIDVNP